MHSIFRFYAYKTDGCVHTKSTAFGVCFNFSFNSLINKVLWLFVFRRFISDTRCLSFGALPQTVSNLYALCFREK